MATAAGSGEDSVLRPPRNPAEKIPTGVLEELPWLDDAVEQVQLLKASVDEAVGSALRVSRSRLSEIGSTSSAHFQQSLVTLQEVLGDAGARYANYEDAAFGKLKEGILTAVSHPILSCCAAAGMGFAAFRRPRRYIFRNTMQLFVSKESLLSSAENKVKVLKQSIDVLKLERQKLEERALMAKNQIEWGKTELRKARNQMQGVIRSVYNIDRRAMGLKIMLRELPRREASQFRSKVSSFPSLVKPERKALHKVISRSSNYCV